MGAEKKRVYLVNELRERNGERVQWMLWQSAVPLSQPFPPSGVPFPCRMPAVVPSTALPDDLFDAAPFGATLRPVRALLPIARRSIFTVFISAVARFNPFAPRRPPPPPPPPPRPPAPLF
ncbi:hypothetical protein GPALN_010982 [Globodera pallida]|nr:hypothetical protein GPALN_010982 [Globodera pallida]